MVRQQSVRGPSVTRELLSTTVQFAATGEQLIAAICKVFDGTITFPTKYMTVWMTRLTCYELEDATELLLGRHFCDNLGFSFDTFGG